MPISRIFLNCVCIHLHLLQTFCFCKDGWAAGCFNNIWARNRCFICPGTNYAGACPKQRSPRISIHIHCPSKQSLVSGWMQRCFSATDSMMQSWDKHSDALYNIPGQIVSTSYPINLFRVFAQNNIWMIELCPGIKWFSQGQKWCLFVASEMVCNLTHRHTCLCIKWSQSNISSLWYLELFNFLSVSHILQTVKQ